MHSSKSHALLTVFKISKITLKRNIIKRQNLLPELHSIASVYLCGHIILELACSFEFSQTVVCVCVFKTFDILRNVCNMKSQLVSVERKFILFLLRHLIIACKVARIAECHRSELYSVKYILSVFFFFFLMGL